MADPSAFDLIRIPSATLIALDWRPYHFALQPYHYLVRIAHILSMAAFFGGIGLLDMRLMGWRGTVRLRPLARQLALWLHASFAIAIVTGIALFFYDPVHVGSHAYFTLKLILTVLGLGNALMFHRTGYLAALAAEDRMPRHAKIAGAVSFALWTGVIVCACLNVEDAPKVLLR